MRHSGLFIAVLLLIGCGSDSTTDQDGADTTSPADTLVEEDADESVDTVSPVDADGIEEPDIAEDAAQEDMAEEDVTVWDGPCTEAEAGTSCDLDGTPCTLDECDGEGQCVETGVVDLCESEQSQQPCWDWTCTPKNGCVTALYLEGFSCDDGNACTMNDKCQQLEFKTCLGEQIPVDDGNPCTDDQCKDGVVTHKNIEGMPCQEEENGPIGICMEGDCLTDSTCDDCPVGTTCVNGECEEVCTPIDGGWSEWVCGTCSKSCGGGVLACTRLCDSPAPSCGGVTCDGADSYVETCNEQDCGNELPMGTTVYGEAESVILGDVPSGVFSMEVASWGGGGGGGAPGGGGGGAYIHASIAVQPGDQVELRIAGGGVDQAGGGGATYVFVNNEVVLVAAGGGGGGVDGCSGCNEDILAGQGGGGGAVDGAGQNGWSNDKYETNSGGGMGASAATGGAGGLSMDASIYSQCTLDGEVGSPHQGGRNGTGTCALGGAASYHLASHVAGSNGVGGGGGSGYFGGGSGAGKWTYTGGGGGGGSSWLGGSATMTATEGGNAMQPGGMTHPNYQGDAGQGGKGKTDPWDAAQDSSAGNGGLIILTL